METGQTNIDMLSLDTPLPAKVVSDQEKPLYGFQARRDHAPVATTDRLYRIELPSCTWREIFKYSICGVSFVSLAIIVKKRDRVKGPGVITVRECTHRIDMDHGRPAVLEATHRARFMKDGMGNVMDVMEVQGNQLEK